MSEYVELHCHSNFSFLDGASFPHELLGQAKTLDYPALALTDHNNLCGAMEFAQTARSLRIQPIIGAEITLPGNYHLTVLASTQEGYSNLCRLISASYVFENQVTPNLDPNLLPEHARGLIVLTGCAHGEIPNLLRQGQIKEAKQRLATYQEWFGKENVYLELQQNLVHGDTERIRQLTSLSKALRTNLVATNNVHYHCRSRHLLQDCVVAIKHHKSLEESHRERRANSEFFLKSGDEMVWLFPEHPEAIKNTLRIAERCSFDLSIDLGYQFPDYPVPEGYTTDSYLEYLCTEAALRRYGKITHEISTRLKSEFTLIRKHNLAGFLLLYHEIIEIAREIQIDLGIIDREVPLEESPPGRGRGSSVSMLVGYLIGLSHIDPLQYGLSMERFLPEDTLLAVPDIDLDFPRNIREELILRVHKKYGWDHAALSGMINTYKFRSAARDIGKALGLPTNETVKLIQRFENYDIKELNRQMQAEPKFATILDSPGWRHFVPLTAELDGFPHYLAQHPGGMIISSSPLIDMVAVQPASIPGRYICQWDKDSIDDARFVKLDFLALGTLSQMQEAMREIEKQSGRVIDISRIDFDDPEVYAMLHRADTIGVFQVESAAQIQTISRIRPRNLTEMAHEVAAVRPGVGANDGVRHYIRRRLKQEKWDFVHPLEKRALARTLGVVLFQDQINQLAIDVAGFSQSQAEQLRRTFTKRHSASSIQDLWEHFRNGAQEKGISATVAQKIFLKFNGQYMFPESHAFAFGVTAYQSAWLKRYYPLEFFLGLFNQQPMGFYSPETLKEDARRHNIKILNPDINRSHKNCTIEGAKIRLGLNYIRNIGPALAIAIENEKIRGGPFLSLNHLMSRTALSQRELVSLVNAGTLDCFGSDRRALKWKVGLLYRPIGKQLPLGLPTEQDEPCLETMEPQEIIEGEYYSLGIYPSGHIMAHLRPKLPQLQTSQEIYQLEEGENVLTAGLVVRRQSPLSNAIFITLEDEFGHIPLIVWQSTYHALKEHLSKPLIQIEGIISKKEGTLNIIVTNSVELEAIKELPHSKNWS